MMSVRSLEAPGKAEQSRDQNRDSGEGGLLQNLFAGLSFPEVPTGAIKTSDSQRERESQKERARAASEIGQSAVDVAVQPVCGDHLLPSYPSAEMKVEERSPLIEECEKEKEKEPTVRTANSLASLYSSLYSRKEAPSDTPNSYPDLPISIVTAAHQYDTTQFDTTHRYEYTETVHPADHLTAHPTGQLTAQTVTEIRAPLQETASVEASCPIDTSRAVQGEGRGQAEAEGCLVSDLIAENARLSAELEQLRRNQAPRLISSAVRSQSTAPSPVDGVPAPSSSSSSSFPQFTRTQLDSMVGGERDGVMRGERDEVIRGGEGMLRGEERQGLLNPNMEATGSREGLKYVCCGSCRTWLCAPTDAMYVRCPGCEAINNCTPQAPAPQTIAMEMPWLNNCFSHWFS